MQDGKRRLDFNGDLTSYGKQRTLALDNQSFAPMSDDSEKMWRPSPTPVESWSDAEGCNEAGEWPVKAIVGEEVRLDGSIRYEVKWGNWHRRDGSNTTWETERTFEKVKLIKGWQRKRKRIRTALADESFEMDVSWPDDAVHKRLTYQRSQAYDEKLEKRRRDGPISTAGWDEEIEKAYGRLQDPERGEANSKLRVRRTNPPSASGPSSAVTNNSTPSRWNKRASPTLIASSRDQSIPSAPPSKRGRALRRISSTPTSSPRSATTVFPVFSRKGKLPVLSPSSAGSSMGLDVPHSTLPAVIVSQPTLRGRVSSAWNKAAREAMAAMVRISPGIPDENFPRNLRKFKYMEKGYVFRDDALKKSFNATRGVFTTCECMTCSDSSCSCRDLSEIYDLRGKTNISAYSEGLFTFEIPRGVEVIECNKYCGCSGDCGNRVVQLPRNIGMEIFDTKRCGWGVRALDDIPRGRVLGTYTGTLIRRDEVDDLPEEHQGYLFDLDSTEVRNSDNLGEKYTVDSYECGNWTRFVNHSCNPNMGVYCVVYDTIPYMNMPYVAFVASTDILAGTELTIDYYPYAETDKGKRVASGDCRCDSDMCRGWFRP